MTEKGLKAGQNISLDAILQDLLQPPADTQVTFLNIQKFINPHYIKEETEKKPRAKKAVAEAVGDASGDAPPPKEKKLRPKVAKA